MANGRAEEATIRPNVAAALREVQDLIGQKKYVEALPCMAQIDAIGDLNGAELSYLERSRAVALLNSGDLSGAAKSMDILLRTGKLGADEIGSMAELLVSTQIRARNYAAAIDAAESFIKNGVDREKLKFLRVQAYYLAERFAQSAQLAQTLAAESIAAKRAPSHDLLKLEASSYLKLKDTEGYGNVLTLLVTYYPSPAYWQDALERMRGKTGFGPVLQLLSYRLQVAVGAMQDGDDCLDMAALALKQGYPAEATAVLDLGVGSKLIADEKQLARYRPLRPQVDKALAEDIKLLPKAGETPVAKNADIGISNGLNLVLNGREEGILIMQKALASGAVHQPDIARMLLAYAFRHKGDKIRARAALLELGNTAGDIGGLARLWLIHLDTVVH